MNRLACFAFLVLALGSSLVFAAACDPGGSDQSGPTPTALTGDLARGRDVFLNNCARCHPGAQAGQGPTIAGSRYSDAEITTVVRKGKRNMPRFSPETIPDEDLAKIIAYIHSLP